MKLVFTIILIGILMASTIQTMDYKIDMGLKDQIEIDFMRIHKRLFSKYEAHVYDNIAFAYKEIDWGDEKEAIKVYVCEVYQKSKKLIEMILNKCIYVE